MAMSPWLAGIRAKVGADLLLLPSAAGLLFDADDRVLLVQDLDSGRWVAPGGYLDPGEGPRECCERELAEELGVAVRATRMLGTFSGPEFTITYSNGHRVQAVISSFECALVDPRAEVRTDGVEVGAHRWAARTELDGIELQPWAARVLPTLWAARRDGPPLG